MWTPLLLLACSTTASPDPSDPSVASTGDTGAAEVCDPDPTAALALEDRLLPADGVVRSFTPMKGAFTRLRLDALGASDVEVMTLGSNPVTALFSSTESEEWLGCVANADHCGQTVQLRSVRVEGDMELELGPWGEPLWIVAWPLEDAPVTCES